MKKKIGIRLGIIRIFWGALLFYFDHNGNFMVATCVGSDTRLAKELIRLLSAEIFNRVNFAYGKLPQVQVLEACSCGCCCILF
jgi:hypothetical protein